MHPADRRRPHVPPHGDPVGCPAYGCHGGTIWQVHSLSLDQLGALPEVIHVDVKAEGQWCAFCGAVWPKASRQILRHLYGRAPDYRWTPTAMLGPSTTSLSP